MDGNLSCRWGARRIPCAATGLIVLPPFCVDIFTQMAETLEGRVESSPCSSGRIHLERICSWCTLYRRSIKTGLFCRSFLIDARLTREARKSGAVEVVPLAALDKESS